MRKFLLVMVGLGVCYSAIASNKIVDKPRIYNSFLTGFYATGTFGYGKTDLNGNDITKNTGFLWNAAGGYRFNKYLATEGGYLSLPNVKVSNHRVKPTAYYAALKGIYPVNREFDVFGKVGVARTSISSKSANISGLSKHKFIPLFGIGGDYNLGSNLAITVQGLTTLKTGHSFPSTYGGLIGLTYTF